ncbi:MAG: linear amide C-N hydrolase [Clostridia bacterium]|nr:linear amide C-N hydrolase [Clostridia bacterium]
MCTSIAYRTSDFYFGRNMDIEGHFDEQIVVAPRNFNFNFKYMSQATNQYAIIGMARVKSLYPLYADGVNEMGLCACALSFPKSAGYKNKPVKDKVNLTSYEVIPYILSSFESVKEVKEKLANLVILDDCFDEKTPSTPLHWMIADENESITLESTKDGVKIYDNPVGVLTNEPIFPTQLRALEKYDHLTPYDNNEGADSLGLGLYGLEGDFSSVSRFIRASMLKKYSVTDFSDHESVSMVLRLLYSVAPIKGSVRSLQEKLHYTVYTSVINASKGIYYYTTNENMQLNKALLSNADLDTQYLQVYPLKMNFEI